MPATRRSRISSVQIAHDAIKHHIVHEGAEYMPCIRKIDDDQDWLTRLSRGAVRTQMERARRAVTGSRFTQWDLIWDELLLVHLGVFSFTLDSASVPGAAPWAPLAGGEANGEFFLVENHYFSFQWIPFRDRKLHRAMQLGIKGLIKLGPQVVNLPGAVTSAQQLIADAPVIFRNGSHVLGSMLRNPEQALEGVRQAIANAPGLREAPGILAQSGEILHGLSAVPSSPGQLRDLAGQVQNLSGRITEAAGQVRGAVGQARGVAGQAKAQVSELMGQLDELFSKAHAGVLCAQVVHRVSTKDTVQYDYDALRIRPGHTRAFRSSNHAFVMAGCVSPHVVGLVSGATHADLSRHEVVIPFQQARCMVYREIPGQPPIIASPDLEKLREHFHSQTRSRLISWFESGCPPHVLEQHEQVLRSLRRLRDLERQLVEQKKQQAYAKYLAAANSFLAVKNRGLRGQIQDVRAAYAAAHDGRSREHEARVDAAMRTALESWAGGGGQVYEALLAPYDQARFSPGYDPLDYLEDTYRKVTAGSSGRLALALPGLIRKLTAAGQDSHDSLILNSLEWLEEICRIVRYSYEDREEFATDFLYLFEAIAAALEAYCDKKRDKYSTAKFFRERRMAKFNRVAEVGAFFRSLADQWKMFPASYAAAREEIRKADAAYRDQLRGLGEQAGRSMRDMESRLRRRIRPSDEGFARFKARMGQGGGG